MGDESDNKPRVGWASFSQQVDERVSPHGLTFRGLTQSGYVLGLWTFGYPSAVEVDLIFSGERHSERGDFLKRCE